MSIPTAVEMRKKCMETITPKGKLGAKIYREYLDEKITEWYKKADSHAIVVYPFELAVKHDAYIDSDDIESIHKEYTKKYGYRFALGAGAWLVYND